jgi:c-di-GMP-binding flagellar brake protein YcgR
MARSSVFNIRKTGGGESAPPSGRANQKRQSYRASIEFPILYIVDGREGTRTATANDLSVGGLRLLGDEDFTKETVIDFRITLPTEEVANVLIEKEVTERTPAGERKKRVKTAPTPFEQLQIAGKIVIAFYNLDTRRFAHGVRFLNLQQRAEDEIQRFIHLYQLKQLRERAERETIQD